MNKWYWNYHRPGFYWKFLLFQENRYEIFLSLIQCLKLSLEKTAINIIYLNVSLFPRYLFIVLNNISLL